MRETEFRLYNETEGVNNRTCGVINYFKCPYGNERAQLRDDGYHAEKLWEIVDWYNRHWNRSDGLIPAESEGKCYHWNEPSIIDVTNLEDIINAVNDGRIDKIIEEHERYKKETRD
jgi:hypothetical protein